MHRMDVATWLPFSDVDLPGLGSSTGDEAEPPERAASRPHSSRPIKELPLGHWHRRVHCRPQASRCTPGMRSADTSPDTGHCPVSEVSQARRVGLTPMAKRKSGLKTGF